MILTVFEFEGEDENEKQDEDEQAINRAMNEKLRIFYLAPSGKFWLNHVLPAQS